MPYKAGLNLCLEMAKSSGQLTFVSSVDVIVFGANYRTTCTFVCHLKIHQGVNPNPSLTS